MEAMTVDLDPDALLSVASFRAACCIGIPSMELIVLLQASQSTSRCAESASGAITDTACRLLLIRMNRALDCVFDGDLSSARHWFNHLEPRLEAIPRELVKTPQGITRIVQYLEHKSSTR